MISRVSADRPRALALHVALILGGSLLMALGARFSVDIGPVPITGQTLALPLVVALLGTRGSVLAMLTYIAEGACGLPVFAHGAAIGLSIGYVAAYPVAAFAIGWLRDRGLERSYAGRWLAIFAGTVIVFAIGAGFLAAYVGVAAAFATGVAPFVIGDLVKITIAAGAPSAWPKIAAALRL